VHVILRHAQKQQSADHPTKAPRQYANPLHNANRFDQSFRAPIGSTINDSIFFQHLLPLTCLASLLLSLVLPRHFLPLPIASALPKFTERKPLHISRCAPVNILFPKHFPWLRSAPRIVFTSYDLTLSQAASNLPFSRF